MKTIAIIIVAALVSITVITLLKTQLYRYMLNLLQNQDYDTFDKKCSSLLMKLLFPKSSLLRLKFNESVLKQDISSASKYLEELLALPLPVSEKEALYMEGFNFYLNLKNASKTKEYLYLINAGTNDKMKVEANRVYNIYILNNDNDLNDLLEELEDMEDEQKGVNEYLISTIYKNIHNKELSDKYLNLSKEHFKLVDNKTREKLNKTNIKN